MAGFKPGILIILLIIIIPLSIGAKEKLIAVFPTWEPYGYMENKKATGFEIETFQAVMDRMGIQVTFAHQPWKRCLYSVENGLADVIISALKVEERTAYLHYPEEPISTSRTALFTRQKDPIVFNGTMEELKGYTIGVTSGFSYGSAFDQSDFLLKDESTETQAMVIKVLLGRNRLGIGNIAVIRTLAEKQRAADEIRFLFPLLHSQNLYAGFSKTGNLGDLAAAFSAELADFKKTARYRQILKKFRMN